MTDLSQISWQGVVIALITGMVIIAVLLILLRNADTIKGLRVSRDGVSFDRVDLPNAIPRIDNQVKVRLQSVVKDISEIARASIDITDFAFRCNKTHEICGNMDARQKILKMLLVSRMVVPLFDSISRNHLVKVFSTKSIDTWIKQIVSEIHDSLLVIEDYCAIDLPDEPLMQSIEKILRDFYIPRARSILTDGIYAKLEVYHKLPDTDKRKDKLIQKCEQYIDDLA